MERFLLNCSLPTFAWWIDWSHSTFIITWNPSLLFPSQMNPPPPALFNHQPLKYLITNELLENAHMYMNFTSHSHTHTHKQMGISIVSSGPGITHSHTSASNLITSEPPEVERSSQSFSQVRSLGWKWVPGQRDANRILICFPSILWAAAATSSP